MWKLVLCMFALLSFSLASWLNNPRQALETALKENRLVAFYFYSNYCPYCSQMEEFVLNQEDVQKKLENFVVVALNISSEEGGKWARKLGVPGVPTIVFYDPRQERPVGVLFGSRPRGEILNYINGICKKHNIKAC
ncbi:MAG: thioredoxin fold domain-containing protein [Aquificaceae bacterium]|nr:thioredoxin fold domain-containing protein [Aquificaceae bacterium]